MVERTLRAIVPAHFQTLSAQWLASWRALTPRCAGYATPRQHSDSVIRWHGMGMEGHGGIRLEREDKITCEEESGSTTLWENRTLKQKRSDGKGERLE